MKDYGIANILVMGIALGVVTGISSFLKIRLASNGFWPPDSNVGMVVLLISLLIMAIGVIFFLKRIKRIDQIDYGIAAVSGFLISSGLYWALSSIDVLSNR